LYLRYVAGDHVVVIAPGKRAVGAPKVPPAAAGLADSGPLVASTAPSQPSTVPATAGRHEEPTVPDTPNAQAPEHAAPAAPRRAAPAAAPADYPGPAVADLDVIVSLSKRRGFIYPSSEIYGGINAVWDYGPLGVELKNNVKRAWWRSMVQQRDDVVGLDAGILMAPQVWVTSGHVAEFSDPLVECGTCRRRYRLDELPGAEDVSPADAADPTVVERLGLRCPNDAGPLSAPRRFNLMLKTFLGPVEDEAAVVYLRPETAQGIYVNFRSVQASSRKKLPFGIAQVGKAFRNEISPGNFVFRMREFEQMEMQYFVRPDAAAAAFEDWLPRRRAWYESYGVAGARLRTREHRPDELAHYARRAVDVEYRFPFGWKELEGVHDRGDFDLGNHARASGENLEYFDPATEEHYVPAIIETSAGADRAAFTFLIDAYREEEVRGEKRVVLGLHPDLAPYKVAVLPLLKKRPEIVELCHRLRADLARDVMAVYDDTAAIGKLYRRQDEIGTPWCVTVDVESLEDGAATIRDRDAMTQERVPLEGVKRAILDRLEAARP
jgi:glycyl-tRNA synthetase